MRPLHCNDLRGSYTDHCGEPNVAVCGLSLPCLRAGEVFAFWGERSIGQAGRIRDGAGNSGSVRELATESGQSPRRTATPRAPSSSAAHPTADLRRGNASPALNSSLDA